MKKLVLMGIAMMMAAMQANAQTDLTGRTYSNPNIMAQAMNEATKEMDQKLDSARTAKVAELEKKKGRKLTEAETAEVDAEVKKAAAMVDAMKKGMKMSIGMEFKSAKDVVLHMKMSVSDDVMKAAGISWAKRKAMKAALAVMPSSEKGTYQVKGNLVIIADEKEPDTLRLSNDGKYLYGHHEGTKYTLTRTK